MAAEPGEVRHTRGPVLPLVAAAPVRLRRPSGHPVPPPPPLPGRRPGELLEGFGDEDLACVRACLGARTVELARGEAAIDELSGPGMMGVVLEGTALEVWGRADGARLILDVIGPAG